MPKTIPINLHDLFKKQAFGHLATIMPDGSPQVTPLWVDYDGKYLVINSALGRQKDVNRKSSRRLRQLKRYCGRSWLGRRYAVGCAGVLSR